MSAKVVSLPMLKLLRLAEENRKLREQRQKIEAALERQKPKKR